MLLNSEKVPSWRFLKKDEDDLIDQTLAGTLGTLIPHTGMDPRKPSIEFCLNLRPFPYTTVR